MRLSWIPVLLSAFSAVEAVKSPLAVVPASSSKTTNPRSTPPSDKALSVSGGASSSLTLSTPTEGLKWAMLLALNTGFLNGICLAGYVASKKQGVSAVTGAWTNSGVGAATALIGGVAASSGKTIFKEQSSILASYIAGSGLYGLLNPTPQLWTLVRSSAGLACLASSACLVLASKLATSKKGPLTCFCLAAMASGIQNSLTSSHSGNLLRTTHYSGMSSDVGTLGGQLLRGNTANAFKFKAFVLLCAAFWVGGFAAVYVGQGTDASTKLLWSAATPLVLGLALLFVPK